MVQINWTFLALKDLEEVYEFIAHDSVKYAIITSNRIYYSVDDLKIRPKVGRIVPEFQNPIIRELVIGNYRLIYKIISTTRVDVIRVYSSYRSLSEKAIT